VPRLTSEQKTLIVCALAAYDTPSEVAESVNEIFGIEVGRQQVQKYDATRAGEKPAKKWVALFEEARKSFLSETSENPLSHRAYRLRTLLKKLSAARKSRNPDLALRILEQAAKEMGHFYTNRRELTGRNGEPLTTPVFVLLDEAQLGLRLPSGWSWGMLDESSGVRSGTAQAVPLRPKTVSRVARATGRPRISLTSSRT